AHQTALAQIDAGCEPTALADCVRYALIQTGINSLAGNYIPELVVRAVETGEWPAGRAFAIARQVPDAEQRSKLYALLLRTGTLTFPKEQEAQMQALAATLAISDEGPRARALAALALHPDGEQLQQAL